MQYNVGDLNKLMARKTSITPKIIPFDLLPFVNFAKAGNSPLLDRIYVNLIKTAQKMKFSISFLRIWSHLLKKFLNGKLFFVQKKLYFLVDQEDRFYYLNIWLTITMVLKVWCKFNFLI